MRVGWVACCVVAACGRLNFDPAETTRDAPVDIGTIPSAHCPPLAMATGNTRLVSTRAQLDAAVAAAVPGDTILLADGTYSLTTSIDVATDNVTLRSASNDANRVIFDAGSTFSSVQLRGTGTTLAAVTMRGGGDEVVLVEPPSTRDASGVSIYDVTFLDNTLGPSIRVRPYNTDPAGPFTDAGTIACSRFVHTTANSCGPDGVFGLRLVASRGWVLRDNYFAGQCSPGSQRAMSLERGSRDTVIVDNVFANNANNIGLGYDGAQTQRAYTDALPSGCTATPDVWGGVVCNNRIYGLDVPMRALQDFDEGISLWTSCDVYVLHNTIVANPAETFSQLEYRFTTTYVHLLNNLVSLAPLARDGGTIDPLSTTTLYNSETDFVDPHAGDLALSASTTVTGIGAPIRALGLCQTDAAGKPRNLDGPTPGAYER